MRTLFSFPMKTPSFAFAVVLAVTALVPAPSQARCDSEVLRQVQAMHSVSKHMVIEFKEEIDGRHVCGPELRFLQTLRTLESQVDRLEDGVRDGDDRGCLERTFSGIKRTFYCVREQSAELRTCACIRELVCKFDRSMDAVEDRGFSSSHRDYDDGPRFGSGFSGGPRRPPMPHEILGGVFRKLHDR